MPEDFERRKEDKERWERLWKKLDDHREAIADAKLAFTVHCKGEEAILATVKDLKTEVFGDENGVKDGLKTDMTNMKNSVSWVWKVLGFAWAVLVLMVTLNWPQLIAALRKL